ncbi:MULTISPECIES: transcriptional regulator FtrA [Burkholderiaceae]|uniref:transcriptional regulator FtrA n=1 Tax=Burkholderiaceae TaxID=119060 RepID=UPI00141E9B40|nr:MULTISPECIES: transcriptional regulator FtrA [Burkholderiaceae]NIF56614.1 transcriptional regulator FtrA [Burkholderia sp. Ax-1724]NIF77942.1 transcriptional regulator FtrA [Paraburkholderia sp. Cy-641]
MSVDLPELPNPLVVVVAYDGLCTFEFAIAVEIFGLERPEMGANWYRFAVAAVDQGPMRGTAGIRFLADGDCRLIEKAGTVVVPGWKGLDVPVPDHLTHALRAAHRNGARIMSICSGAMVMAAAGLLSGRKATLHWKDAPYLSERYPNVTVMPDVLYVDDGDVLTSAGGAAGIDLCLHLIRRDFGTKAANMVARRLIVQPHRDGGQAQFIDRAVSPMHESGKLGALLDKIRSDLTVTYSITVMAEMAGMSKRTFLRRFETAVGASPAKWLNAERLSKVVDLLENTDVSMEEIARIAGYASTSAMRHQFQKQYSLSPVRYRKVFSSRLKP